MPKLSATIVAYNNYSDIQAALASIEKHTDKSVSKKIYIVDNGASVSNEMERRKFIRFVNQFDDSKYLYLLFAEKHGIAIEIVGLNPIYSEPCVLIHH